MASNRVGKAVFYVVLVVVVLVLGGWLVLRYGPLPVAVGDNAFPLEKKIVRLALQARIGREMKTPPIAASEAVFVSGAHTYVEECAVCHGTPGSDSRYATSMYPAPPQLWKKHGKKNVVGVSDDDAGSTYWIVEHGIRLTGMPAFGKDMTDDDMWKVTLLLKNADMDMSVAVKKILSGSDQ